MEKEFVPYQPSFDMKELGFDEPCFWWYDFEKELRKDRIGVNSINSKYFLNGKSCSAPLYQQAFRWFREKYDLYINLIYDWNDEMYRVTIMVQNEDKSCKVIYLKEGYYIKEYKTLEEAQLECLKKLIEIVKEKL